MEDPPKRKPTFFKILSRSYNPVPVAPTRSRLQIVRFGGPSLQIDPIQGIQLNESLVEWTEAKYQHLYINCQEIFSEYYGAMDVEPPASLSPPKTPYPQLDSVAFWHKLIMVIATKIVEIRLNRKMMARGDSQLLASTFWTLLSRDLKNALKEHEKAGLCKLVAYLHLQNRVKWMHKMYVEELPLYSGRRPEFELWFEPFVVEFLTERDILFLKKLAKTRKRNRYYACKKDYVGYPPFWTFPISKVLSHLTASLDVIDNLETRDVELKKRYYKRYAETTITAVEGYTNLVREDFSTHLNEIVVMMALMTNMKLLEGQVDALIQKMGGTKLEPNTAIIFRELCKIINATVFSLGKMYANRPLRHIDLNKHIYEILETGAAPERKAAPKIPPRAPRGFFCLLEYIFKLWRVNTGQK